ncbi:hypothetical protein [Corallococcus sp. 4LFB]|uniref:hypothetical protein n=1 Tax=Corallococcus sp. 4LFB TaxID=3383249 RepID=UPI003976C9EB
MSRPWPPTPGSSDNLTRFFKTVTVILIRPWGTTVIDLFGVDSSDDYGFQARVPPPGAHGSPAVSRCDFRPAHGAPRVQVP